MEHQPDGVDVGLVASEGLRRLAAADIPELCSSIAGSRNENVLVGAERQADICIVRHSDLGHAGEVVPYLITSPVWSLNSTNRTPASMSQSMQVMSPEEVTIWRSLRKRQQLR